MVWSEKILLTEWCLSRVIASGSCFVYVCVYISMSYLPLLPPSSWTDSVGNSENSVPGRGGQQVKWPLGRTVLCFAYLRDNKEAGLAKGMRGSKGDSTAGACTGLLGMGRPLSKTLSDFSSQWERCGSTGSGVMLWFKSGSKSITVVILWRRARGRRKKPSWEAVAVILLGDDNGLDLVLAVEPWRRWEVLRCGGIYSIPVQSHAT